MPEVRVLGPVEVLGENGQSLPIGGPQPQRLIAALALMPTRSVRTDRLVEAVWPDEESRPADPRNSLQAYVSRLRGVGLHIDRVGDGYALGADVVVDSHQFAAQVEHAVVLAGRADPGAAVAAVSDALSHWRGGVDVAFGDEDWALAASAHLCELRLQAREDRVEWQLAGGDSGAAAAEAAALVAEHPLRERPHRLLMQVNYAAGDAVEALRVFQSYRTRLLEEVGLEPSAALVELERAVAAGTQLTRPSPTKRLGSYEVGELIGEGAFGAIYRAAQPSVGREVAIKVVRPELANDLEFVRRFEVEAQTVARLEHPHIVPLYDYWRDPSGAYLVMRYLSGGSAERRLIRDGPWALADVARLVDEIGPALALAHEVGVLHRDVKPANVLFDEAGNSYLADFGIATGLGASETAELRSAGSPLYAAPEQVRDGHASPASDIYGFGVMLYELLAGVPPYADSDSMQALLERKVREQVPSLSASRTDVPEAVDLLVRTATAPDAGERFESMGELVLAFRAASADLRAEAGATDAVATTSRPRLEAARTLVGLQLETVNPYKGLAAFDESDESDFYGRAELATEIVQRLRHSRFLVVTGPSGSGKSSVVRAGVLPRLRGQGALVASIVPGSHPMDELETALLRISTQPSWALLEQLASDERGLGRAVKRLLPDDGSELVLVVDQFEELFTQTPDERRDAFLAAVASAVNDERSRLRVVCTLRADFYDRPLQHRAISELVRVNTLAVTQLTGEELDEAITRPASSAGVTVEPALVAELISACTGRVAGLPLLQFALTEIYERRSGGRMTLDAYRSIGGIGGALANRADQLYTELSTLEQEGVRRLFTRLVTPGEGTEDTRRRVMRSELSGIPTPVLDAYGAARLLTFDHDPTSREPTLEVGHEALIREWPRLRAWVDGDREWLRVLRHLGQAAETWQASGRSPDELYRGGRLEAAEEASASHLDELTELEARFLQASTVRRADTEAAERRRLRRLRTLLMATAMVAAVAVIAGMLALQQRGEAREQREVAFENAAAAAEAAIVADRRADAEAQARTEADTARFAGETERLAAAAPTLVDADFSLGLLVAVEAARRDQTATTFGGLQRALVDTRPFLGLIGAGTPARQVTWVRDDLVVAFGSEGVRSIRPSTGEVIAESAIRVPDYEQARSDGQITYASIGASAPGAGHVAVSVMPPVEDATRQLALTPQLIVLDVETLDQRWSYMHPENVHTVATSPGHVATLDAVGDLRLFDAESGQLMWTVSAHPEGTVADQTLDPGVVAWAARGSAFGDTPSNERYSPVVVTDSAVFTSRIFDQRRWDLTSGALLGDTSFAFALSPDVDIATYARTAAEGFDPDEVLWSFESTVTAQEVSDGVLTGEQFQAEATAPSQGTPKVVQLAGDTSTGSRVVWALLNDGRLVATDLATATVRRRVDTKLSEASGFSLSPDGSRVAVAGQNGIGIFSTQGGGLIATSSPRGLSNYVFLSPLTDLAYLDSADFRRPESAPVASLSSGRIERVQHQLAAGLPSVLPGGRAIVNSPLDAVIQLVAPGGTTMDASLENDQNWTAAASSPDGQWVAVAETGETSRISIFDAATGRRTRSFEADPVDRVATLSFSPGGRQLLVAFRTRPPILLAVPSLEFVSNPVGDARLEGAVWSDDGRYLITVDQDRRIVLRSPDSFDELTEIATSRVPQVNLRPPAFVFGQGNFLVGDAAGRPQLWNARTGDLIGGPFPNDPGTAFGASDGRPILVTPVGRDLLTWNLDVDTWVEIACQGAGRNMTRDEWNRVGPKDEEYRATCPRWPIDDRS